MQISPYPIIALNSLIGFTGDLGHFEIDWVFPLIITAIAIIELFIGGLVNKKVDEDKLKSSGLIFSR